MRTLRSSLLILLCALLVASCGFQLRGSVDLPYSSLYIALPESSRLRAKLTRIIGASSKTVLTDKAKGSQAILAISGDLLTRNILSLNAAGRVTEIELVRTISFRVYDPTGRDLIAPGQIVLRRDVTYDDNALLSKQSEETLLVKDMENDMIQQLMRRLAASKPEFAPATATEPENKG